MAMIRRCGHPRVRRAWRRTPAGADGKGADVVVDKHFDNAPSAVLRKLPAQLLLAIDADSLSSSVEADPGVDAGARGHVPRVHGTETSSS
jgi:hypothetical protein